MKEEQVKLSNLRENWVIFLLLLPTIAGVMTFNYAPAIQAVTHSFYNWDGDFTEEFTGLENFRILFGRLDLWSPLLLTAILIGTAGLLSAQRWKLAIRRLGLVSMAITLGLCVRDALGLKDKTLSDFTTVLVLLGVSAVCGILAVTSGTEKRRTTARVFAFLLPLVAGVIYLVRVANYGDNLFWWSFRLIFIHIIASMFKMWPSIFTAVCIHRLRSDRFQYLYRVLFVVPMIIPHLVGLLIWKFFYDPNVGVMNHVLIATHADAVLAWLDQYVLHIGCFLPPFKPAWLGDPNLVISALVFWGFPWVGVIGVLIYLAGLQNISEDVYEAADLDGITWWGKFWRIELPLIMTQIRLNVILMIIGVFQAWGFEFILLGVEGGPQNKGMNTGLFIFYQAFQEQRYGLACAVGLVLFFIILTLTIINQRYVKVEK